MYQPIGYLTNMKYIGMQYQPIDACHNELDDHDVEEYVEELYEAYDVEENIHEDEIDDDMSIETNIDDDDMAINPFNVESRSDDLDVGLDKEDGQLHWIVWGMP